MGRKNSSPSIAVVILNWNGGQDTVECLDSLLKQEGRGGVAIVIDNGSKDDSLAFVRDWASRTGVATIEYTKKEAEAGGVTDREEKFLISSEDWRLVLIANGANLGFAAGNNVGLRYALARGYSTVMLLNNDMALPQDTISTLTRCLARHPEWVGLGAKVVERDRPGRILFAGGAVRLWQARAIHLGRFETDSSKWTRERPTGHLSLCCALYKSEFLREAGLLDEEFFFGQEDVAFSVLAHRHGRSIGVCLDAVVHHRESSSLRRTPEKSIYYYAKYRLLLLHKYGSFLDRFIATILLTVTRIFKFAGLLFVGKWRRVRAELLGYRDFFAGRLGEYDRKRAESEK